MNVRTNSDSFASCFNNSDIYTVVRQFKKDCIAPTIYVFAIAVMRNANILFRISELAHQEITQLSVSIIPTFGIIRTASSLYGSNI